jgi:sec-independent protein translocase protein TatA
MSLPSIGPLELIIILAIALLIVGPKRLPEMGNAFGRTIREFRKATTDVAETASIHGDVPAPPPHARPSTSTPDTSSSASPSTGTHATSSQGTQAPADSDATNDPARGS